MPHPKICYFGKRTILSWRKMRINGCRKKPSWSFHHLIKIRNFREMRTVLSCRSLMATKKIKSWHQDGPAQTSFPRKFIFPQFAALGSLKPFPFSYHFCTNLFFSVKTLYEPQVLTPSSSLHFELLATEFLLRTAHCTLFFFLLTCFLSV